MGAVSRGPVAPVANDHKPGGLKQQKLTPLQFRKPEVETRSWQVCTPLTAPGSLSLLHLGASGTPWLAAASLRFLPLWSHYLLSPLCVHIIRIHVIALRACSGLNHVLLNPYVEALTPKVTIER